MDPAEALPCPTLPDAGAACVLVVDDEDGIRLLITRQLRGGGFEVQAARSCREAIESARRHNPDLMILDVVLGGGSNGFQARNAVEAILRRRVPTIMISGKPQEAEIGIAAARGDVVFLEKRFENDELLATVRRLLNQRLACDGPRQVTRGAAVLDVPTRTFCCGCLRQSLSEHETLFLKAVMETQGPVASSAIANAVWGHPVEDVCVRSLARQLRKSLAPFGQPMIITISGGYLFVPPNL